MKKVIILYDSVYGNTKKVAMSLSRGLEAGGLYVDSSSIKDFDITRLENYDIIGIGGPTHFHGASKQMKLFLNRIKHIKMVDKYGFAFETKGDFKFAGSAARRIIRHLKMMKLKIIHSAITGIVLDKEGPLQKATLGTMEQIGLVLSDRINHKNIQIEDTQIIQINNKSAITLHLNQLKWIFLGGGPIFFFIRALYLASTGGDCFGTINPVFSWILLSLEISLSGITGAAGILGLVQWKRNGNPAGTLKKLNFGEIILLGGIITYIIHLTRVAIWIILCVL